MNLNQYIQKDVLKFLFTDTSISVSGMHVVLLMQTQVVSNTACDKSLQWILDFSILTLTVRQW